MWLSLFLSSYHQSLSSVSLPAVSQELTLLVLSGGGGPGFPIQTYPGERALVLLIPERQLGQGCRVSCRWRERKPNAGLAKLEIIVALTIKNQNEGLEFLYFLMATKKYDSNHSKYFSAAQESHYAVPKPKAQATRLV